MNPLVWLIASAFVIGGILAYSGIWKGWIRVARGYGTYMGFCLLYFGIALIAGAIAVTAGVGTPWGISLLVLAALLVVVSIVGFWWLPSFLQPAWFRRLRADALDRDRRR